MNKHIEFIESHVGKSVMEIQDDFMNYIATLSLDEKMEFLLLVVLRKDSDPAPLIPPIIIEEDKNKRPLRGLLPSNQMESKHDKITEL